MARTKKPLRSRVVSVSLDTIEEVRYLECEFCGRREKILPQESIKAAVTRLGWSRAAGEVVGYQVPPV